ncbi:hypothetical protein BC831DRAFT_436089 [Entophlyctis helioformis]|nr:hypothetical protein BC831DRAFT_436089 [Entophlyctis helioformis]
MGSITFTNQDTNHSFVQHTWSTFSNMSDGQRNQLLKGLIGRCSSKQIEMICTCLNLKTIDTSLPGYQVPPKILPEDVLGKYSVIKHKKFAKSASEREIPQRVSHHEILDEATRKALADGSLAGFASAAEGTYMNANIYIKLLNSNIDPDLIPKQLARAGPDGIRFLITFLSSRCKKLQSILQTMYDIAIEIEMDKAMMMLLQCVLDATEAKHACLYFTGNTTGKLVVRNNNWPDPRENATVEEVFAGNVIFKGERVNVYNVKTSEHYTDTVAEAYQQVEADCILSAPVFGDGMKVSGLIEVINKTSGNPFFNAEDEFMIKALASLGTLLFNHANVKQSAIKKTDDIKVFLNTASMMTSEKADMGDLLHVIMQTARELVTAERCTLFMLDREKEELWSTVAQGSGEIRIPMNKGIAGHVAMTGETLNIPDAYADSRFNREVDMRTGFRTRNILCMAMFDQHQEIIGVTQVINKLPEQMVFTKEDEMQLASFSSLAASTIEKQLAFKNLHSHLGEMIRSRTYMSAMLQSMNSVVLSLNTDGRLVSVNNPDRMGFTGMLSTMRLTSFEHWLGHDNAQLVDDITRAQVSLMPVSGRNCPLVVTNQPIRFVHYYIRRIAYDPEIDRLMEVRKTKAASRINTGKKARPIEEQIPEAPPVSGILVILEEVTPESSLEESLGRQLTPHTMHRLMDGREKLHGEILKVTVLVADIRSFSATTDGLSPTKIVEYLNNFYDTVAEAVQSENGIIIKLAGDSATAVFGMPFPHHDDSRRAMSAALKIRHAMEDLNKRHEESELPGIRVGVGIATGDALCGAIGPTRAQEYSVVGEPLLLAHRLEEIAKVYGTALMTTDTCREEVKELFHAREVDITTIRGFSSPMTIYEVMASSDHDLQHDVMTTLICFELGLSEYRAKNWQAAIMHFKKAIALSDDRPSRTFIERCKSLIDGKYEVPEEWDGVWRYN